MSLEGILSIDALLSDFTTGATGACWTLVITSEFG
jgi:hypothetical protein